MCTTSTDFLRMPCLVMASVCVLSVGVVSAQFGSFAKPVPTTPEQQTAITQATNFLSSVGENLGGTTIIGADVVGNAPAVTSGDGATIGIDFDRLEA